jgi:hypothetical protein
MGGRKPWGGGGSCENVQNFPICFSVCHTYIRNPKPRILQRAQGPFLFWEGDGFIWTLGFHLDLRWRDDVGGTEFGIWELPCDPRGFSGDAFLSISKTYRIFRSVSLFPIYKEATWPPTQRGMIMEGPRTQVLCQMGNAFSRKFSDFWPCNHEFCFKAQLGLIRVQFVAKVPGTSAETLAQRVSLREL